MNVFSPFARRCFCRGCESSQHALLWFQTTIRPGSPFADKTLKGGVLVQLRQNSPPWPMTSHRGRPVSVWRFPAQAKSARKFRIYRAHHQVGAKIHQLVQHRAGPVSEHRLAGSERQPQLKPHLWSAVESQRGQIHVRKAGTIPVPGKFPFGMSATGHHVFPCCRQAAADRPRPAWGTFFPSFCFSARKPYRC